MTYENDSAGVALNFEALGRAVRKAARSRSAEAMVEAGWAEEIRDYHEGKSR